MTLPFVTRLDGAQKLAWIGGSVHRVLLDGTATDDRLSAFRSSMRGPAASPVHVHDREDETVFVLDGSLVFWAGDQRWELGAGDTAFLPRAVPHTYFVASETADLLTLCNPSGMEEFFRSVGWDLARPAPDGWSPDLDGMRAAAEAGGQHILAPPLGPNDAMPPELLTR